MRDQLFAGLLDPEWMRLVTADHVYRALAGSGAGQGFDFRQGRSADEVVVAALEQAARAWAEREAQAASPAELRDRMPRTTYSALGALPAVETVGMNRGTWNEIVELGPDIDRSVSAYAPGQSGFVGPGGPAPHTHDQLELYVGFRYKPLLLDPFDGAQP
ncbi:MAG: hypothetical protein GX496_07065 [Firmicutes bacterium]|nr:hypothetical protein [Bacillota bacterium]